LRPTAYIEVAAAESEAEVYFPLVEDANYSLLSLETYNII
jgi:hypothetical protein